MEIKAAKELIHIRTWVSRVDEIVDRGREAYLTDDLLQEAGDSLMMKLGEAANRLSRLGVLASEGVEWALAVANRNFIIHQYDEINRELTWITLCRDLPAWKGSLQVLFDEAETALDGKERPCRGPGTCLCSSRSERGIAEHAPVGRRPLHSPPLQDRRARTDSVRALRACASRSV
ncbi:HepT-like ribonuclease domain-containing protein [Nocardioides stalactiti]|uniref:HepT-like ribonuclease domain-containing protein n=1 Tax=Nocardioides stalactiti TaxID=2755356 RepID=UPI0016047753